MLEQKGPGSEVSPNPRSATTSCKTSGWCVTSLEPASTWDSHVLTSMSPAVVTGEAHSRPLLLQS